MKVAEGVVKKERGGRRRGRREGGGKGEQEGFMQRCFHGQQGGGLSQDKTGHDNIFMDISSF